MSMYQTQQATFDIHETDTGKWTVIHVPNLKEVTIGTGKFLATFETENEAQRFCDTWTEEQWLFLHGLRKFSEGLHRQGP